MIVFAIFYVVSELWLIHVSVVLMYLLMEYYDV